MAKLPQHPHPHTQTQTRTLQVGRRWSTGKPLRMAVLPDTGSDWELKTEKREDWRREKERDRGQTPTAATTPSPPPPQSIWPCQNIKCMLLLLSKRCLRFLKALIQGQVDGNQDIFSCAKRVNNTQLIIAQQRGLNCVCKSTLVRLLHSTPPGEVRGRGQVKDLSSLYTNAEICLWGQHKRENELMALDFYCNICQNHFTH